MYNGILINYKREGNLAICSNMYGSEGYYTKWISQSKTLYDFIYMFH